MQRHLNRGVRGCAGVTTLRRNSEPVTTPSAHRYLPRVERAHRKDDLAGDSATCESPISWHEDPKKGNPPRGPTRRSPPSWHSTRTGGPRRWDRSRRCRGVAGTRTPHAPHLPADARQAGRSRPLHDFQDHPWSPQPERRHGRKASAWFGLPASEVARLLGAATQPGDGGPSLMEVGTSSNSRGHAAPIRR